MATQNPYNNYIKRQTQSANNDNNFRQKIKNSLGGVPTGGNASGTPQVTQLGSAPKSVVQQPTQPITTPPTSQPKSSQPTQPINTPVQPANAPQAPVAPQTPIAEGSNTGLVSQSEINQAFTPQDPNQPQQSNEPLTQQDVAQINEISQNPEIQRQAYAEGKTPQQMAQELLEQQKKLAQQEWEQQKKELEEQKKQLQGSYQQSTTDAESKYSETVGVMNENRYAQQEALNVSGTNRGIQYSPQQLGLENVANINHNKNLAEASKQRNELLNKLQIEINNAMANVNLGLQNATNKYNQTVGNLQSEYMNKIMNWEWDKSMTDEERKWQEAQTQKDREWQEKMDKADKEFQKEMAKEGRGGYSSGYGGSYGGSSWKPYGGSSWKNYGRSGGDWQSYSDSSEFGSDNSPITSEEDNAGILSAFKEASQDYYDNTIRQDKTPFNAQFNATDYDDMTSDIYSMKSRMSPEYAKGMENERRRVMAQNWQDVGRPIGKQEKKDYVKNTSGYIAKNSDNKIEKRMAQKLSETMNMRDKGIKNIGKKTENKPNTPSKPKNTPKPTSNKKVEKSINKSVSNSKKSVSNSKKNVKESTSNAKKNTKKSTSNFTKNLKKNISNIFKKKEKKKTSKR